MLKYGDWLKNIAHNHFRIEVVSANSTTMKETSGGVGVAAMIGIGMMVA